MAGFYSVVVVVAAVVIVVDSRVFIV